MADAVPSTMIAEGPVLKFPARRMLWIASKMDAALKDHVVLVIRDRGVKGLFSNFRRITEDQIDLLTFRLNKWGNGFVVGMAVSPAEGVTMYWRELMSPTGLAEPPTSEQAERARGEPVWR